MVKLPRCNPQGLSRKSKGMMSCITASPQHIVISSDLVSAEPGVTAQFSNDKNYYAASFGMEGKLPYYEGNMLVLNDVYLMVASVVPMWAKEIKDAFHATYGGKSFSELWIESPDTQEYLAKKVLGHVRVPAKTAALGLSYGCGVKKLLIMAYENGFILSEKDARAFKNAYWSTFSGVKRLSDMLIYKFKRDGYLVNSFGFRLLPDAEFKCLNAFIQSSVSGILNALCAKFFTACDFARFNLILHDELIMEVPIDREQEAHEIWLKSVDSLNEDLGWSVPVRVGWKSGLDWYAAH